VAIVVFAALLPLVLNVTGAGGVPVEVQAYVRFDSPPSSAPSTLSVVAFVPVGFGFADAAVKIVGAALATVTLAVAECPPAVAVTTNGPPGLLPAVNRPVLLIVPPPLTVHVNVGCGFITAPNWSVPLAVNCCVPLRFTVALPGATVTLVTP
jgi:hypothetical protein